MILALAILGLLAAALLGIGLVYDGLSRERRRIERAAASLAQLEERRGAAADPAERTGVDAHVRYAREHLEALITHHNARIRDGAVGAVARGLKLSELRP